MTSSIPALAVCLCVIPPLVPSTQAQTLPPQDRIRIAEAFRLADFVYDTWPDWRDVPFALLLVTPKYEFLVRHPRPGSEFTSLGYDQELYSDVLYRSRVFDTRLLATFPAVGGIPTVVIGQPGATGQTSTSWVLTVLHEHFHQLQMSDATYYTATDSLGLAGGDDTGMWMLNYPFPYDSLYAASAIDRLASAALLALRSIGSSEFPGALESYRMQRDRVSEILQAPDYRYLSFQLWQEGIARYTELVVARRAAGGFQPSERFGALTGYVPFPDVADALLTSIEEGLEGSAQEARREIFYPIGAVEGLLLDEMRPDWKQRYLKEKFYLERYFTNP